MKSGRTALIEACLNCDPTIVELLLKHGANINHQSDVSIFPVSFIMNLRSGQHSLSQLYMYCMYACVHKYVRTPIMILNILTE